MAEEHETAPGWVEIGKPLSTPNPTPPSLMMTNRELQQAIIETFEMWLKTNPPEGDELKNHLRILLDLQLSRARGAYIKEPSQ